MSATTERVRRFLDARERMTGPIDPQVLIQVWVAGEPHELTVADLRTLIREAEAR